jgi:hypothetical protein
MSRYVHKSMHLSFTIGMFRFLFKQSYLEMEVVVCMGEFCRHIHSKYNMDLI